MPKLWNGFIGMVRLKRTQSLVRKSVPIYVWSAPGFAAKPEALQPGVHPNGSVDFEW